MIFIIYICKPIVNIELILNDYRKSLTKIFKKYCNLQWWSKYDIIVYIYKQIVNIELCLNDYRKS